MTAIYLTGISYANLVKRCKSFKVWTFVVSKYNLYQESVLEFIYKGDVSIPVERLDDFLNTAHKLQVNQEIRLKNASNLFH